MKRFNSISLGLTSLLICLTLSPLHLEARQGIVLFDESHGQKFLAERDGSLDLSKLSDLIEQEGMRVKTSQSKITDEMLSEVDALIISGAFEFIDKSEIKAISKFITKGGRVCIMLHIGPPLLHLLKELNIYVSKGVVREQDNVILPNETDFYASVLNQHTLVTGIERFKVFGGWALLSDNPDAVIIAHTSDKAWLDTNMNNQQDSGERTRSLNLTIASKLEEGEFVVFGDDAIFQNSFLTEENTQLGKNLARWLKGKK